MSREHVFSQTLLRLYDDVAPFTIDQQRGLIHGADPVIKDLCEECNSGLSKADAAIRIFAESHLRTPEINAKAPDVDPRLLKLWVVKTAANISRSNKSPSNWWHPFIPFMRGLVGDCDCDVLFTRWEDVSPFGCATAGGIVLCIEAREALLFGFAPGSSRFLRSKLNHAEAVKVGFGVFLLLAWKPDIQWEVREQVLLQIREFGWLPLDYPFWLAPVAFNITSCATFSMIAHPLVSLPEAIAEDRQRQD